MWDNHEFSWMGWQSFQPLAGQTRPAQTRKVAANQAWFEYQPARVRQPKTDILERFEAPAVQDAPIAEFDDQGLGREPNNLTAIRSLIAYRGLRWGKHLDLLITDQHSFRRPSPSRAPTSRTSFPNRPCRSSTPDARLPAVRRRRSATAPSRCPTSAAARRRRRSWARSRRPGSSAS
jgi:hypothetical protein